GRLLNIATEYNAPSCALFLLKRGIPMSWTNAEGKTPVQVACAQGRPEILEMLLDRSSTQENESVDTSNASNNAVTLVHPLIKMDILQSCDNSLSFLRDDLCPGVPVFFATKVPANLDIMEVLVRHSARFDFPTPQSRDSIAPLLTSWLLRVAPSDAQKLLVDLATSGSIRHQLRHVVLALTWQEHTYEALLLALLLLFSPHAVDVEQALAVFKPWMARCQLNVVTQKLLTDALTL
ncbi:hypothetical protein PC129_g21041, partial [Phytophthora cactorum]